MRARQQRPESGEWLPLGVFALTQDGEASGAEPTLFMQLAISKEGVIAGTFNNMETDQAQTLEGMGDKTSQRVAWTIKGQKRPIMETGLGNLTQDSSPAAPFTLTMERAATVAHSGAASRAKVIFSQITLGGPSGRPFFLERISMTLGKRFAARNLSGTFLAGLWRMRECCPRVGHERETGGHSC